MIQREKEQEKLNPSFFKSLKESRREAFFAIMIGFTYALTFYSVFYGIPLILFTEDIEDKSEVRLA